jgi:hypothetical protein
MSPQLEQLKMIAREQGTSLNNYCMTRILENPQLSRIEEKLSKLLEKNGIK